jgi:hypothetical protein
VEIRFEANCGQGRLGGDLTLRSNFAKRKRREGEVGKDEWVNRNLKKRSQRLGDRLEGCDLKKRTQFWGGDIRFEASFAQRKRRDGEPAKTDCANWRFEKTNPEALRRACEFQEFEKTNPNVAGPGALAGFVKTKPISWEPFLFGRKMKKRLRPEWARRFKNCQEIQISLRQDYN